MAIFTFRLVTFLLYALHIETASSARINLGRAARFAALAYSTITNTGPTFIYGGDIGVSPGTSITGFSPAGPGQLEPVKTQYVGDAAEAVNGQIDANASYVDGSLLTPNYPPTYGAADLGGQTLYPGVYKYDSSVEITGQLTLENYPDFYFGGDEHTGWVFQIASTLTLASDAVVRMNGFIGDEYQSACNVFWLVGSSATLGTNSTFWGNILAVASITLNTDADIGGGLYALNGAVTFDTNTAAVESCETSSTSSFAPSFTSSSLLSSPALSGGGGSGGNTGSVVSGTTATAEPGWGGGGRGWRNGHQGGEYGGGAGSTVPGTMTAIATSIAIGVGYESDGAPILLEGSTSSVGGSGGYGGGGGSLGISTSATAAGGSLGVTTSGTSTGIDITSRQLLATTTSAAITGGTTTTSAQTTSVSSGPIVITYSVNTMPLIAAGSTSSTTQPSGNDTTVIPHRHQKSGHHAYQTPSYSSTISITTTNLITTTMTTTTCSTSMSTYFDETCTCEKVIPITVTEVIIYTTVCPSPTLTLSSLVVYETMIPLPVPEAVVTVECSECEEGIESKTSAPAAVTTAPQEATITVECEECEEENKVTTSATEVVTEAPVVVTVSCEGCGEGDKYTATGSGGISTGIAEHTGVFVSSGGGERSVLGSWIVIVVVFTAGRLFV